MKVELLPNYMMKILKNIAGLLVAMTIGVWVYSIGIETYSRQVTFQVELESASDDECQLFYDNGFGFSENRSVKKSFSSGDGRQIIEFSIPKGRVRQLRIDPGFGTDSVILHKVMLYVDTSKIILNGKKLDTWATTANTDVTSLKTGTALCKPNSTPEDMQIILKASLFAANPALTNQEFKLILGFSVCISLLLYWIFNVYRKNIITWFISLYTGVRHESTYRHFSHGLVTWMIENKYAMGLSMLAVLFSYGYELTSFSLSMDEELEVLENALPPIIYVSLSRYGIFILKSLTQNIPVLPYIPFAVSLILLAFSNVILTYLARLRFASSVVFTLLFLSSPVFSYYLLFNTINAQISFGIFLVTLAYALNHRVLVDWCAQNFKGQPGIQKTFYVLSILLLAFAFSIYQATILYSMVVFLFLLLSEGVHHPGFLDVTRLWLRCKNEIIRTSLALVVYKAGDVFFKYKYGSDAENYITHEYLQVFILWPEKTVQEIISVLMSFIPSLFEQNTFFGGLSAAYIFIPVIGIVLVLIPTFKTKINWNLPIIIVGLLMAPFILTIVLGSPLPYRTYFSFPVMVAGVWGIFHQIAKGWFRGMIFIVSVYFFVHQSYTVTHLFFKDHLSNEASKAFVTNLSQSVRNLDWPDPQKKYNVVFVGALKLESFHKIYSNSEIHGISSLIYEQGIRYNNLFLLNGQTDFTFQELQNSNLLPCEHEGMPSWPAPGSVRLVGNTALVKISEPYSEN